MRRCPLVVLFVVLVGGCGGSPADVEPDAAKRSASPAEKSSQAELPDEKAFTPEQAVSRLRVGMSDAEVTALSGPVSLDQKTKYFGGSGAKLMYFQVSPTKQLVVYIGGSYDQGSFGKVVSFGPTESDAQSFGGDGK